MIDENEEQDDEIVDPVDDDSEEAVDDEYDDYEEDEDDHLVTIREADYEEFERRSKKLRFLEEAGVDNWEGYDNAMEDMTNFEEDVDE
jgi:hypothetical protein